MDKKKSLLLLAGASAATLVYNIWKPVKSELPVIQNFDLNRYLGLWYEVARMDFYWEKGLKNVTATYTLQDNGSISVINQGQRIKDEKPKRANGKAKLTAEPSVGALKVSFFGPFYSGYNIMHIGGNYDYALVFGDNLDYLWILSRTKTIPPEIKQKYITYAQQAGYAIQELVWTIQD